MNFLVAQMISCYNPFETKERNLIKIYPFETKERNLIKIYSFEKGIHMKAISKMKSLILKYRHAWVLLYGLIYMPWFCYLEKRQTIHYLIHSPLDEYIPFVEYFIIPYLLWNNKVRRNRCILFLYEPQRLLPAGSISVQRYDHFPHCLYHFPKWAEPASGHISTGKYLHGFGANDIFGGYPDQCAAEYSRL